MQPRLSSKHNAGMTLFEVGVVVAIVVFLAVIFLPMLRVGDGRLHKIGCTNNLKQIAVAYEVWAGDNGDIFPMGISITNGGSMEMVQTGNVVQTFIVMSNELSTPKILYCPEDSDKFWTNHFAGLSNSNISYFVSVDLTNIANPQMIFSGDCNFELGGKPVKPGLNSFWTNDPVAWHPPRHNNMGNLIMVDGSVQGTTSAGLQQYLINTFFSTNRFAIP